MRIKKDNLYDFSAFGAQVKRAREKAGLTREETACKINISPRHLSAIEIEGRSPSANILFVLADFFQISLDQFIFNKQDENHLIQISPLLEQLTAKELDTVEIIARAIIKNREN